MKETPVQEEINKRLTLNWLIQGAAQHAGMTFHHLVSDQLGAVSGGLVRLYDQYALINLLQYWHLDAMMLFGSPPRFWRKAITNNRHPFFNHPLLSRFGGTLAETARQRALERASSKGVTRYPVVFSFQVVALVARLKMMEKPHRPRLIEIAKEVASSVWGVPISRLDGYLDDQIALGRLIPARTVRGAIWRASVVGYGGVVRRGGSLVVIARGTNWQLLTKELVKGTAELICLHGLNSLSDDTYRCVMDAADRIELEPWMLQTGGELWRLLLAVAPDNRPIAEILMHLALLPAKSLESLITAVIEQPEWAKELLAGLGTGLGTNEVAG
jgi:hypothetical protein